MSVYLFICALDMVIWNLVYVYACGDGDGDEFLLLHAIDELQSPINFCKLRRKDMLQNKQTHRRAHKYKQTKPLSFNMVFASRITYCAMICEC